MILHALNDYYQRRQRSPDPQDRLPAFGLEEKEIPFVIEIDADGQLVNLVDTRTIVGKKKIGQRFLVPQGVKKTSGVAANLLWDTAEYVLGVDTKGKPERVVEQHAAFCVRVEGLPDVALKDAGIQAVLAFFKNINLKQFEALPVWTDILAANPNMTFRLHGDVELICQRPAVATAGIPVVSDESDIGLCLVSGKAASIERLHPAIKGVWGAQSSGANIVSINNKNEGGNNSGQTPAFASYGKQQGFTSPVGKPAVFAYTTALNHLLARDSRQRIQVGDASTVFWAEQEHDLETALPDLFGEPPKDDPNRGRDALNALYQSIQSGKFTRGESDTRFHVLGLAPNAARIAIRFWETAPAHELARRIAHHFDDIKIAGAPHDPEHLSLFRLLTGLAVQGKADNIPPNLGGEVMRAILEELPYPAPLLNLAVQRCRAEQKPTYARAAVIKASLNRLIRRINQTASNPEKEFQTMLDSTNTNLAYRFGRLFAVLEKIQEESAGGTGKLNATIRDRYFGAASSSPSTVFPMLLKLKNHHVSKLDVRGQKMLYRAFSDNRPDDYIGQVLNAVPDIPNHLTLQDQGRFNLGYYHQRQAFFTKPEPQTTDTPEISK